MRTNIRIGDAIFDTELEERQVAVSKHSGRNLSRYRLDVRVRGEERKNLFVDAFTKSGAEEVNSDGSLTIRRFDVLQRTLSYQDHGPHETVYSFSLELQEVELLNILRLIIDGVPVEPYKVEESIDNDSVIINGRYRVEQTVDQKFHRTPDRPEYFPVIREGISSEPISMRCGKTTWSQDGAYVKREFVLVAESYDAEKHPAMFSPELKNMQADLVREMCAAEELRKLLVAKNILTQEEVTALMNPSKDRLLALKDALYELKDIDEWE